MPYLSPAKLQTTIDTVQMLRRMRAPMALRARIDSSLLPEHERLPVALWEVTPVVARVMLVVCAAMLFVGGAVAAAENSVPGDALYPVKAFVASFTRKDVDTDTTPAGIVPTSSTPSPVISDVSTPSQAVREDIHPSPAVTLTIPERPPAVGEENEEEGSVQDVSESISNEIEAIVSTHPEPTPTPAPATVHVQTDTVLGIVDEVDVDLQEDVGPIEIDIKIGL